MIKITNIEQTHKIVTCEFGGLVAEIYSEKDRLTNIVVCRRLGAKSTKPTKIFTLYTMDALKEMKILIDGLINYIERTLEYPRKDEGI